MADISLEAEIADRRASIARAERSIADTEQVVDNSTYTNIALSALRMTVAGEKAVLAKLRTYNRLR